MKSEVFPTAKPAPAGIAAPSADGLRLRMARSFEGLEEWRSQWDEATARLGGPIYMSFDWCRTWWEFYGDGKELRVFVFTAGDEVVGILPLYIDSLGGWPLRFRVARLVGANIPPKVFDPPICGAWAEPIFERILRQLFGNDRCDLLSFGPVSELHKSSNALMEGITGGPQLVGGSQAIATGVHTVFELPDSVEAYFDGLNKSERKKRQYELRLLRREHEVAVDLLREPAPVEEEFERFVAQHSNQWKAEGKPGHFGAWPKAKEFNAALVKAQAKLGRVRFHRIFADGRLASSQYTFAFGKTCFWELPARLTGREWDRYSLGSAGAITMIEAAIREGMTQMEGGLGHYDYKIKLGGKQIGVRIIRVLANRTGSRIRLALVNVLRLCVFYGYHRIWYRRISPRLPAAFRRPQWRFWLRLDF